MLLIYHNEIRYLLRFLRGEEIASALESFCAKENIFGAWVEGIGAADEVEIGYYDYTTKSYKKETHAGDFELLNLTGNIALKEGKPFLHAHVTLTRPDLSCFGGHLFRMIISATCEVLLTTFPNALEREHDDETNLFLLNPKP